MSRLHNCCDCGVFSLLAANCLILNEPLKYSLADIPLGRRWIALQCLQLAVRWQRSFGKLSGPGTSAFEPSLIVTCVELSSQPQQPGTPRFRDAYDAAATEASLLALTQKRQYMYQLRLRHRHIAAAPTTESGSS